MDCDDSLRQDSSDEELSFLSEQLNICDEQSILDVNENISETSVISEDILEASEFEAKAEYPNLAYADFMTLVTKHKINNATSNAIIKFFNKHANLEKSPLPKSIQQGRKYMDNMNLPNLKYHKTQIITYNDEDYFLHHRSLIDCIKNILSIPDLSQNFTLNFEELEINGERAYGRSHSKRWLQNNNVILRKLQFKSYD